LRSFSNGPVFAPDPKTSAGRGVHYARSIQLLRRHRAQKGILVCRFRSARPQFLSRRRFPPGSAPMTVAGRARVAEIRIKAAAIMPGFAEDREVINVVRSKCTQTDQEI